MTPIDNAGNALAPLQIVNYGVDALDYSPGSSKSEEGDLEAILDLSFLPNTRAENIHGMQMTVELHQRGEGEAEEDSFKLVITVTGHFKFIDDPSNRPEPEHLRTFFFTTSVGTLYGIVREKVRAVTAQSASQGVVIPIINLGAMAEGLEEEEDLEHFNFEDAPDEDTNDN